MSVEYTKHQVTKTIWYCTLVRRWVPGRGRRLELLVVTPEGVECKPLPADVDDAHNAVGKAIREAYNQLDLVRRPIEIRSNDAALARDLTLHLRGVDCIARHQKYWVKLEMARRLVDVMSGPCRSRFDCEIAEERRHQIAKNEPEYLVAG